MHFVMKDLFSSKMMGTGLCDALEEQYNIYTIDPNWAIKHDASSKIISD